MGTGTLTFNAPTATANTFGAISVQAGTLAFGGSSPTSVGNTFDLASWTSGSSGTLTVADSANVNVGGHFYVGINGDDLNAALTMTGGTITAGSDPAVREWTQIGAGTGTTAVVAMSGSSQFNSQNIGLGFCYAGSGTMHLSDTAQLNAVGELRLGRGGDATVTLDNSAQINGESIRIANGGTSNVTLNGTAQMSGTIDVIVANGGGAGTLTLNGTSSVNAAEGDVGLNTGTTGTFNMNEGSSAHFTAALWIGQWDGGSGVANVGGSSTLTVDPVGTETVYGLDIGTYGGVGVLTISDTATVTATGTQPVRLGGTNGTNDGNGTINLNGGALVAPGIFTQAGSQAGVLATVNFQGGTLKATMDNPDYISGANGGTLALNVLGTGSVVDSGAVIHTNGYAVTIAQPLVNGVVGTDGGLTKLGAGTLTLTAANTYTGLTTVNGGTLELANAAAGTDSNVLTNAQGIDLQAGLVVFNYAGGDDPAAQVLTNLKASYHAGGGAFTSGPMFTTTGALAGLGSAGKTTARRPSQSRSHSTATPRWTAS